jgi:hypothetical protein
MKSLEDITRPALFPDYEWHSDGGRQVAENLSADTKPPTANSSHTIKPNKQRQASHVYLINKGRELHERFQQSACHLQALQEVDVARYSSSSSSSSHGSNKRPKHSPDEAVVTGLLEYSGMKTQNNVQDYLPKELWTNEKDHGTAGVAVSAHLDALAVPETGGGITTAVATTTNAEDAAEELTEDDDDTSEAAAEEEEEDADYATNYYASDDDNDDGGDDEAVF